MESTAASHHQALGEKPWHFVTIPDGGRRTKKEREMQTVRRKLTQQKERVTSNHIELLKEQGRLLPPEDWC